MPFSNSLSASHDCPSDNIAKQLFLEQARAYYRDMKAVADNAPDGHVIGLRRLAVKAGTMCRLQIAECRLQSVKR